MLATKEKVRQKEYTPTKGRVLIDVQATPFSLLRRSNPKAAFDLMMRRLMAATKEKPDVAKAFASFQKNFRGVMLTQEDAKSLAKLQARSKKKIKIGHLPSELCPGLAFAYDAGLQVLR